MIRKRLFPQAPITDHKIRAGALLAVFGHDIFQGWSAARGGSKRAYDQFKALMAKVGSSLCQCMLMIVCCGWCGTEAAGSSTEAASSSTEAAVCDFA